MNPKSLIKAEIKELSKQIKLLERSRRDSLKSVRDLKKEYWYGAEFNALAYFHSGQTKQISGEISKLRVHLKELCELLIKDKE